MGTKVSLVLKHKGHDVCIGNSPRARPRPLCDSSQRHLAQNINSRRPAR